MQSSNEIISTSCSSPTLPCRAAGGVHTQGSEETIHIMFLYFYLSFFFLKVLFERNPCQRLLIRTPDPTRAQKSFEGNKSSSLICQWA